MSSTNSAIDLVAKWKNTSAWFGQITDDFVFEDTLEWCLSIHKSAGTLGQGHSFQITTKPLEFGMSQNISVFHLESRTRKKRWLGSLVVS